MARQKKTAACPLGGVGIGGKWKFWIWYHLLNGTKRFGELQRLIPQASRQMLTMQLRELEQIGAIHRQMYVQMPPKVEYSLTKLGWDSEPILRQFYVWGKWHSEQIGLEFDDWLTILGNKWKFWAWYHLLSGAKRFSELQRLLPHISQKMLTMQLRELEQMRVLHRQISVQMPSKIEYSLTELGRNSEMTLRQMYAWGRWYGEQIDVVEYDWPVNDEAEERPHW